LIATLMPHSITDGERLPRLLQQNLGHPHSKAERRTIFQSSRVADFCRNGLRFKSRL
jgi:hypothetical protein